MSYSKNNRKVHRAMSITFTATVLLCFIAVPFGALESAPWIFYLPLPPLFVLMGTGLYMYAQPYLAKRRNGRPAPVNQS
ncbi:hypothetical protein AB0H76_05705 [Nocardia sp. NPDC050712]|uniref:hypothetical protein n=1 Tax=Nocardia sp. NPDC050712 TaxID=3155518 RepID=UPI0033FC0CC8